MPTDYLHYIPTEFVNFALVAIFALLIGLEQRRHNIATEFERLFGTDRTFTLIGVLGYILYIIAPQTLIPFLGGGAALAVLLGIYYLQKMRLQQRFGMTSIVTALITYSLAPLVVSQPHWLTLLVVVCILVLTEVKEDLFQFTQKFDTNEFITLAKFLIIAGVILPLLPDTPISPAINISPYRFWLAVVAVSAISYLSYLLRKFAFPRAGLMLTAVLGGLYSSTATTVILARKSKEGAGRGGSIVAATLLATATMYVRVFLLALFFNGAIAADLVAPFALLVILSIALALFFALYRNASTGSANAVAVNHGNPLEFKTAFIFAALFVFLAFVTNFAVNTYGAFGVKTLSFVVGVTDIDPFILNLLQSKWNLANALIAAAVVNATTSNNALKLAYALSISDRALYKKLIAGFGALIASGIAITIAFPL